MALVSNSNAPYAPAGTVVNILSRFREKGLTAPITPEVLLRAGVPESLISRTFQSLQLLELISEDGQPTEMLKKLREVPQKDYQATLAAWLKQVYADVFAFADPGTDEAVQVRDAFRTYLPHGQQDRMVKLFMALCAEAGLADEKNKAEQKSRSRKILDSVRPVTAAARAAPAARQQPASFRQQRTSTGGHQDLPPALGGLMASLPPNGWTKETRDKFVRTFESVLDFVIPIVENETEGDAP